MSDVKLTKTQEKLKQCYAMIKKVEGESIEKSEQEFDDHIKALQDWAVKANETHHSTNTGYGAEMMPNAVQGDINMELVHKHSSLAGALKRGYMWTNMPFQHEELIIGNSDDFVPNSEHTGATGTLPDLSSGTQKPQTDSLIITQRQFKKEVQLSKLLYRYGAADFVARIRDVLAIWAGLTIDKFILNADDATSGNINLEGATPSGVYYLLDNNGIRDTAIANSNTHDGGTLTADDLIAAIKLIGHYGAWLDDLLWVCPMNAYLKLLALEQVLTVDKFWPNATFSKGVLAKAFGIDILVTDAMPSLAQSSGKVHTTSWNNTLSQIALVYRPAVIHGSGDNFDITPTLIPGLGVRLTATFDYGMGVAYNKAGLGATTALIRNITV